MTENADNSQPGICLLTDTFYPRIGGGETHARLLARELKALGSPIFVLTRKHERGLASQDKVDGVKVIRVRPSGFPRFGKYLMLPFALQALFRHRHEYDIIYVCGLRVQGIAGMLAGRLFNKRVVLRSEACGEWSGEFIYTVPGSATRKMNPLLRAYFAIRNQLFKKADRFLAISRVIHEEFTSGGIPEAQIATITNGMDFTPFSPVHPDKRLELRREFGLGDAFVFAYSGKLNRGKGLEMLLRAWKGVVAQKPNATLLLIGAGGTQFLSCEQELRSFVQTNDLGGSVVFTGYTNRVADYLHQPMHSSFHPRPKL